MGTKMTEAEMNAFYAKSREAAAEGAVLIRNENCALPIKSTEKVSVFGRPQIEYYRSGTGSGGAVRVEYTSNLIDGFKQVGINYNEELTGLYTEWLKDNPFDNGGGGWACEPWFQKDMPLTDDIVNKAAAESDKAIYVIGRTAGEDKDNAVWEGSYILTSQEKENLLAITKAFETVIVVLNVSNIIDMSWVDAKEYNGRIKAIIYTWAGGMEGGYAAADVISGKVTPSGKLPDTVAFDIKDYPSTKNFGNEIDNYYEEDIYVGYRYFETFAPDRVQYEFGFGISYTTFDISNQQMSEADGIITVKATVTNTGDTYSGKEVLQVYYCAPQGKLGKPSKQLIAYVKTDNLAPGQSAEYEMKFKIEDMASYDDSGVAGFKSAYVLEEGDYEILLGNSVKNVVKVGTYNVEKTFVIEQLSEVMAPVVDLNIMKPGNKKSDGTFELSYVKASKSTVDMNKRIEENLPEEIPYTGDKGIKLFDVRDKKASLDDFIAQLSVEDMAVLVRGEGMSNPRVTQGTASAFGGMSDSLFGFGIPAACCADGPSGIRMEAQSVQLPIGTLLASSWNAPLVKELYTFEGMAMLEHNIDTLLGPGVNIHRNPLNGRNFEYYSEDPYLTGTMVVATTMGIKTSGVCGTIKHYALNGQEAHRFKINAICSERAIREIYLKAFEMAVKSESTTSIMTSYNPINGHWSASNYDLCTTVLRGEWGYKGIVMTDWWASMNDVVDCGAESRQDTRDMIRSQNDVYMVVNNNGAEINTFGDNTEESIKNGRLTVGELQRAAKNILTFLLNSPVINRELVEVDTAEKYEPTDSAQFEMVELTEDNRIIFDGKDGVTIESKEEEEYAVIVNIMSPLTNLSQSTCKVHINGTVAFIIQTNGTDGKWIKQKLVKIKLKKGCYNIMLEHSMTGINVDYIQLKKVVKR